MISKITKAIKRTIIPDVLYGGIERYRGISYPSALIGRRNALTEDPRGVKVLAFAAHPDDEVLGVGQVLARHRANGDDVAVVFTTNGSQNWTDDYGAREAYAAQRFMEACDALSVIGIPSDNVVNLGFPDAGLRRFIPEAATDVESLILRYRPKIVYVHGLEGGHIDHDVTSFVVQHVCAQSSGATVYEWAEYNREIPLAQSSSIARFPADPYVPEFRYLKGVFAENEYNIKIEMLRKYVSQHYLVNRYPLRDELLREANPEHLAERLGYFAALSKSRLRYLRVLSLAGS